MKHKIDYSRALVEKALAEHERPVVGCSFGKDSVAVLHMVRQIMPDVEVVFINTGVEYPQTVKFARQLADQWDLKLTVLRPETTFWKIVEQYGFPLRTRGAGSVHSQGGKADADLRRQSKAADVCCERLKKKPMKKAIAEHGYDLLFDGMTAAESQLRRMIKYIYGDYHFVKTWNLTKCHPIMDWSPNEVWQYHRINGIPYNPLYDLSTPGYTVRTGCWCCTIAVRYSKLKFLREHFPRHWRILLENKGLAEQLIAGKLDQQISDVDHKVVRDYLNNYPCFFDKIN